MVKNYDIPFVANIPVEVEERLNEQANQEITYLDLKNKRTLKKFMDVSGKLRLVADYLSDYFRANFMNDVSYDEIARALGISEQEVKNIISELAGWDNYPFVIIRTPKKSGFIQLHSKNLEDTEKWITTALRHITSRQQRLDKTVNATQIKRRERKRNRIKNAEEIVEEVRERIETEE
jgi:AraC-like DNA-binding protein